MHRSTGTLKWESGEAGLQVPLPCPYQEQAVVCLLVWTAPNGIDVPE